MKSPKQYSLSRTIPVIIFVLYTFLLLINLFYRQQVLDSKVEQQGLLEVKREMSRLHSLLDKANRPIDKQSIDSRTLSLTLNKATDSLALISQEGTVLYSTDTTMEGLEYRQVYPNIAKQLLTDLMLEAQVKLITSDDGQSILSLYSLSQTVAGTKKMAKQHLILKYDLSRQKTIANDEAIHEAFISWLAGLVIYVFLVYLLDILINKPLRRLVHSSQQISQGNLDARVIESGAEELIVLGRAFNNMASNIDDSYKALQDKATLYNVLSASNQAVIRSNAELALLTETCRVMTELGSFNFAWVGLLNKKGEGLEAVAKSQILDSTLSDLQHVINTSVNWPNSVTSKAIIQNKAVVYNDIHAEEVNYPPELLKLAVKRGVKSIAAFPLVVEGKVIGAITISNFKLSYFSQEYIQLLSKVAADTSFGITSYRKEAERKQSADLLSAQQVVLERIAAGQAKEEIFELVCQQIDTLLASINASSAVCWVMGKKLNLTAHSKKLHRYKAVVSGSDIVAKKNPSMDSILQGKRIIASSLVNNDPWVDLEETVKINNLPSCFCTPILSAGAEALGSLDIYYEDQVEPKEYELAIVDRFVYLCGLAIERDRAMENIRQREENLAVTLDSIGDAVITVDIGGRVTRLNPVASNLTGWASNDALGKPLYEVFHIINTQTRLVLKNPVEKVILTGKVMGLANHTSLISKTGQEYQIADSAAPILDNEGNLRGVILVFQDVTTSYATQDALQKSYDQLSAFNSVLPDLAFIFDEKGTYIEIYGSEEHLLMSDRPQLLGKKVHDILPKDKADETLSIIKRTLATQKVQVFEYSLNLPRGTVTFEARVAIMTGAAAERGEVVFIARDISERKKSEQEIEQLAFYDPLTKIPNRRLLMDRLSHEISIVKRHQHQLAILFLDLDHFKTLNDSLGHSIGDSLLEQVAQRISRQIRGEDTVARLGGDEFIILLSELNNDPREAAKQASYIADKIKKVLTEPFFLFEHQHYITASIGISLFSADTDASADDLLKHADNAMYKAKSLGRNQTCFYLPDMQAAADTRLGLEIKLREAIRNNDLEPFYQPQVNSQGQCVGLEVLLRWNSPEEGMISPATFIPVAEDTGLISPLGNWVLRKSCEQIKKWHNAGIFGHSGEHFAVNISPKQFAQTDFVKQVENIVNETGIDPKLLYLEVTEGTVIDKLDEVIDKMEALKVMNIRFSMDDFGTGYSSLSHLKRLPLQQLKIDRSFIRDIATDESDRAIINAILAVSDRLSLDVVAEGVETEEQLEFLKDNGCVIFQGYHFGKPMPAADFENWLKGSAKA